MIIFFLLIMGCFISTIGHCVGLLFLHLGCLFIGAFHGTGCFQQVLKIEALFKCYTSQAKRWGSLNILPRNFQFRIGELTRENSWLLRSFTPAFPFPILSRVVLFSELRHTALTGPSSVWMLQLKYFFVSSWPFSLVTMSGCNMIRWYQSCQEL